MFDSKILNNIYKFIKWQFVSNKSEINMIENNDHLHNFYNEHNLHTL